MFQIEFSISFCLHEKIIIISKEEMNRMKFQAQVLMSFIWAINYVSTFYLNRNVRYYKFQLFWTWEEGFLIWDNVKHNGAMAEEKSKVIKQYELN